MPIFQLEQLPPDVDLDVAFADRVRRGILLTAIVVPALDLAYLLLEIITGTIDHSRPLWMRGILIVLIALVAWTQRKTQPKHQTMLAGSLVVLLVGSWVAFGIESTGGAESLNLALFAITVAGCAFFVPLQPLWTIAVYICLFAVYALCVSAGTSSNAPHENWVNAYKVGFFSTTISAVGSWLHYRILQDTFTWRRSLREESRRAALALERARIARDLHDHVGARLTGIALRAEREQKRLPRGQSESMIWIQDTVRLCLEELRDTIWALSHSERDARELVATLRRRAEDISDAADLTLHWTDDDQPWQGTLSPGVSVALSAILREALTNVVRHSTAKECWVSIKREKHEVTLVVIDNGRGLAGESTDGRGLNNMRQRAREQHGELVFEMLAPHGLRISARIPLQEEKPAPNTDPRTVGAAG